MPDTIARFQEPLTGETVRCTLCPRSCVIAEGKSGFCRVRVNRGGVLFAETWGKPAALQVDPIEKKPLAFFLPGSRTFSIGTFGCNLGCRFCQNDELSRNGYATAQQHPPVTPEELVELARRYDCPSIASTYNEPTVFFEYLADTAKLARVAGLKTVLVSNGFIAPEAARELYRLIDAANIDVKAFDDSFYRTLCDGTLAPVLTACEIFRNECGGHLELTNLIIPDRNDAPEKIHALLDWVEEKLGRDTPIHFSAYFPAGGYHESPPTPAETLFRIREQAIARGFSRIRLGNLR